MKLSETLPKETLQEAYDILKEACDKLDDWWRGHENEADERVFIGIKRPVLTQLERFQPCDFEYEEPTIEQEFLYGFRRTYQVGGPTDARLLADFIGEFDPETPKEKIAERIVECFKEEGWTDEDFEPYKKNGVVDCDELDKYGVVKIFRYGSLVYVVEGGCYDD